MPKRRWYQLSLRIVLVFVSLISVPLAWLAYKRDAVRQRDMAVMAVERLGGMTGFVPCESPPWARILLSDDSTTRVFRVYLARTNVSDADLKQVSYLTDTKFLDLSRTQITDAGLVHLASLSKLEGLYMSGVKVGDSGLASLAGLRDLKSLDLTETLVTDRGLVHLKRLTKLEALHVNGTGVTAQGISELKKSLPTVNVLRNPDS
jgi:hypothetical protein